MSPCRSDYIFTRDRASVWHVVSEDSDHFSAWFAVVHRLGDFGDLEQPTTGEMRVRFYQPHALNELHEIKLLGSSQGTLLEERNDYLEQILPSNHTVSIKMFLVIVESTV